MTPDTESPPRRGAPDVERHVNEEHPWVVPAGAGRNARSLTPTQPVPSGLDVERLAMAIPNVKGGSPMFGVAGECECREDAAAIADEYERLGAERDYLRRLPWRENVVLERLDRPGNRADGAR